MKQVTICADDFGYHPHVSTGILELIKKNRINATSCMTNMPDWPSSASQLNNVNAQVGLHFNLTDGKPFTDLPTTHFGSLKKILLLSHCRLLKQTLIEKEFTAQLDAFTQHLGREPDFIDGHQHVHQFPIIRDAILSIYRQRLTKKKPWVRVSANANACSLKTFIIGVTGAYTLKKQLQDLDIPHNSSFSGIYDFSDRRSYDKHFEQFLKMIKNNGLIMCHPASSRYHNPNDDIALARVREGHFFHSDKFIELMQVHKVSLSPLSPDYVASS